MAENVNQTANQNVLVANNLCYAYGEKQRTVAILDNVSLVVRANENLAIVGASGTGKSTLLHVLGGLDSPQSGDIILCGQPFNSAKRTISASRQGELRNQHLGFVYQFHHLLPEFSALENVMMPLLVRKTHRQDAAKAAQLLLDKVGIGQRHHHKPSELSGGERQRVAIARAMVTKPDCILADEPTGNLDQDNAESVMSLLFELQKTEQTALVIVTHDKEIAGKMDSAYALNGRRLEKILSL
ncbi:MAG: lipoprotein-releasing system ATP-binding protein LolD [Gammaproteobacteria bacterium]|nr:MAG: lipoprotein-releasing system ATP-binding protein LolD [Gammaproteobacteria bacterium]